MASKDPTRMFDVLSSMRSKMEDLLQDAESLISISAEFGGIIAREIKEQIVSYYAPSIKNLIEGERVPGSLAGMSIFLDSVPLAMTRSGMDITIDEPVVPENVTLTEPAGSTGEVNPVEELPQNASFAQPEDTGFDPEVNESCEKKENKMEEAAVPRKIFTVSYQYNDEVLTDDQKEVKTINVKAFDKDEAEKSARRLVGEAEIVKVEELGVTDFNPEAEDAKITESKEDEEPTDGAKRFVVIRKSNIGSALGDDVANLEPQVYNEFHCKEDAEACAEELNATIDSDEKELFGTEYVIEERIIPEE